MTTLRILIIGATGFVGGSTVDRLLKHPRRSDFDITILLRSESRDKAKGFEALGLNVVLGSLKDLDILERLASESDVTFQSADCDALPATEALLRGIKKQFEETKKIPVYIHTTGGGNILDHAKGEFAGKDVYSDLDTAKIESLPITNPHRDVDVTVVEANRQGYVKAFIVSPSCVWGVAENVIVQQGLQNPYSGLGNILIGLSVNRGTTVVYGAGNNVWSCVNIDELIDFYLILFDAIISGKNPAQDYYFLENEEVRMFDLCAAIGKGLLEHGKVYTAEPIALNEEERTAHPLMRFIGGNSRARGDRARSLGWKPVKGVKELIANVGPEVDFWVKRHAV